MALKLTVNQRVHELEVSPDTPLLYVLINDLELHGPRFGCGLAQCGSCSVLADGLEIRSCVTPIGKVDGKTITTFEGLPAWYAEQKKLKSVPELHPLQRAVIDEQATQCGYCLNGLVMKAAELLSKTAEPSEQQIRTAMNGHLCRCGTYPRFMKAIQRAAHSMTLESGNAQQGGGR
jgi:aerobic-type carbon monoxide dehydrogenase small subunit (CoxS/CutS family)